MKIYKTLLVLILPFLYTSHLNAQCNIYAAGPYSDQAIDLAGCDGESVAAPYQAWQNEVYFSVVQAGGNYTFELVGCTALAWGGDVEITAIDGGTQNGFGGGNIVGGVSTVAVGCSVTFTATVSDTTFFVVTTVGGCGTPVLNTDNGTPTLTTNSGVPCGTCGLNGCEPTEDYCNCPDDCPCTGDPVWVSGYDTGNFAISADPVVYCESEVNTNGVNTFPSTVYIPFAPLNAITCVDEYTVTTDFGTLHNSTDPISDMTTPLASGFIGLLGLNAADVAAAAGTVTLTFTDATTAGGCTFDLVLDVATALNSAGAVWSGDPDVECPAVCAPVAGTFVSYDCAGPSVTIEITDLGTPTSGSTGFTAEVRDENGTVLTSGIAIALGNNIIPLPDNDQIYNVVFTDGITAGCEVGFFNSTFLYGNCRQMAGPSTDCIFLMDENGLDGDFEELPTLWTADPAGSVSTAFPLDSATGAFLGGFGTANVSSVTQSITIPASAASATLYYWIWFGACADATDIYTVNIDGTPVQTFDGSDARCGGNWVEESVDLSAFADGLAHDLKFEMTETGSGLGDGLTAFLVDDLIIEVCNSGACPPDLTLTTSETGSNIYVAESYIISTDDIIALEDVTYNAGDSIVLKSGFTVELDAEFEAIIGGCIPFLELIDQYAAQESTSVKNNYIAPTTNVSIQRKETALKPKRNLSLSNKQIDRHRHRKVHK